MQVPLNNILKWDEICMDTRLTNYRDMLIQEAAHVDLSTYYQRRFNVELSDLRRLSTSTDLRR